MSVRNAIVLLLALSTLTLLVACGGSSSPKPTPPPSGGFSNSNLSGTYVFTSSGVDNTGGFLAIAGTLVADGKGGISGGTVDIVGVDVTPPTPIAQAISGGSYSVSVDGRGQASLSSSAGNFTLDFVLQSNSHGLVTLYDSNGTGSGTLDLQTAVPSLSGLAGPYAFSLAGIDNNGAPLATAGAFTLNSTGTTTVAGIQDFNDAGIPLLAESLSAAAAVGSGTGPGTITLTTNFGALTFDFYPIDPTHLKFIETDYIQILVGDVFSQTGASIPVGPMVFTMSGGVSAPIAVGGVMTSDGTGSFTGGLEDVNDNGVVPAAQVAFTGTPVLPAGVGGRLNITMNGFVPATQWTIYPSTGGVLMLETDATTVTTGAAYAQTSTAFAASDGYGFNLSAFNTGGFEEDDIAEFTTTSSAFSGIVDINDQTSLSFGQSFNGLYNAPDTTGRGTATTTANNNTFVSFTFYVVDGSTFILLETDANQIGTGTFQTQSNTSAAPANHVVSMARPPVHSRGSLRHRTK
jgi:adhesin HecA-like repeat protein